jgi:hypothetical protein
MTCPFSQHLPLYGGPRAALEAHVHACKDCQATAATVAGLTAGDPTSDCVEVEYLHAYLGEMLPVSDPDDRRRNSHIASCGYCQRRLLEINRVVADQTLLAGALLQGDAYLLARDFATWLSSSFFPRESETVRTHFGAFYKQTLPSPDRSRLHPGDAVPVLAFGTTDARSVSIRILTTAVWVARSYLASDGSVPALVASLPQCLTLAGLDDGSDELLAAFSEWLSRRTP